MANIFQIWLNLAGYEEIDLGNLHQSEMNKLNILSEKTYTGKVGKENKD